MSINPAIESKEYTIQVRQRGQVTIPGQLREALSIKDGDTLTVIQVGANFFVSPKPLRTPELSNRIADIMEQEGVTLADLLEDLPAIREEIFHERYGNDAS